MTPPTNLFFEDFRPGQRFESGVREVTEDDLARFTDVSGDAALIHTDAEVARQAGFKSPIAHGPLGIAVIFGLLHDTQLVERTAIAMVDLDWRFTAPVFVGDALRYEMTITRCRRTATRPAGVVNRHFRLINQDNLVVQEGSSAFLVQARGDADADASHIRADFGSAAWAAELSPLLAAHPGFAAATRTFDGSIGFEAGRESIQFRVYKGVVLEVASATPGGPTFTMSGSELAWIELATAERNDYIARAALGDFQATGNIHEYRRMTKALVAAWDCIRELAQLAGDR